ncbi:MAG: hypothetical protein IPP43_16425 [Chitinophagaceae bacterium]|nr:hypothetical protein [Chitinophagaceae bacterium]
MYAALVDKFRSGAKKINYRNQEWFTVIASLLTLLVFSLSKFQLPYYANIIFPMLAVLTAAYLNKIPVTGSRVVRILSDGISFLFLIGGILLMVYYDPVLPSILLTGIIIALIALLISIPFG